MMTIDIKVNGEVVAAARILNISDRPNVDFGGEHRYEVRWETRDAASNCARSGSNVVDIIRWSDPLVFSMDILGALDEVRKERGSAF